MQSEALAPDALKEMTEILENLMHEESMTSLSSTADLVKQDSTVLFQVPVSPLNIPEESFESLIDESHTFLPNGAIDKTFRGNLGLPSGGMLPSTAAPHPARMTEEELEQQFQELERSRSQASSRRASPTFSQQWKPHGVASPARPSSAGGKQRRAGSHGSKSRYQEELRGGLPSPRIGGHAQRVGDRPEVADVSGMPLRIEMNSDRSHTVDQVPTPEGLITMVRLTRKNETTRNTVLCCRLPLKPMHNARLARIDLLEGEMVVSHPLIEVDLPFNESKDPGLFWAKLDVFMFNSSNRGGKCYWQTQRRKTLFLFYSGSIWGVPVYIVPRDSHYSYSVMQDEHIRILLKQFYDTFCKIHPSVALNDPVAVRSLYSFALSGNSAYIATFMPYIADKEEVDGSGCSALHIACRDGHIGCVYRLVQGGANIVATDSEGNTPLHLAALRGHTDIAVFLMSKHFSMISIKNAMGQTASDLAVASRRNFLGSLLDPSQLSKDPKRPRAPLLPDQVHDSSSTFHNAVLAGDIRTVLFLLQNHQDRHHPNELDEHGNTAVLLACEFGQFDVLLALLIFMHQGPPRLRNLNIVDAQGQTPLIVACQRGHSDCVMALLRFGKKMPIEVDAQDVFGRTALHCACEKGRAMISFVLLAENARQDILDSNGKRPVDLAIENNHTITQQVINMSNQERNSLALQSTPDIQLFLETFGYVERLDFLNDLRNIKNHVSNSMNFVTDELTSAESTTDYGTDYLTDDGTMSESQARSRRPSQSRD